MVIIGAVVMQVSDVRRAAEFWIKTLGYVPRDGHIDEDWVLLVQKDGNAPALALGRGDRMHLDLFADDADQQRAEVERLVSLGARRVDWPYPDDPDFVVLADTEGNLFCVVDATHT